jgi:enamine deaminase RidA (YjgF/YER057c/UK114 family)
LAFIYVPYERLDDHFELNKTIFRNVIALLTKMIEEKLTSRGVNLDTSIAPIGSYAPVIISGNLVFVSGQIAVENSTPTKEVKYKGKVGKDITTEDAKKSAELCVINCLVQLKSALGDLERIKKIVKLSGFVNCDASFTDHPTVLNGASDFLVQIFGEAGKHARIAVGASSLPMNSSTEIDMIVEV